MLALVQCKSSGKKEKLATHSRVFRLADPLRSIQISWRLVSLPVSGNEKREIRLFHRFTLLYYFFHMKNESEFFRNRDELPVFHFPSLGGAIQFTFILSSSFFHLPSLLFVVIPLSCLFFLLLSLPFLSLFYPPFFPLFYLLSFHFIINLSSFPPLFPTSFDPLCHLTVPNFPLSLILSPNKNE